jgi:hypothetical protein
VRNNDQGLVKVEDAKSGFRAARSFSAWFDPPRDAVSVPTVWASRGAGLCCLSVSTQTLLQGANKTIGQARLLMVNNRAAASARISRLAHMSSARRKHGSPLDGHDAVWDESRGQGYRTAGTAVIWMQLTSALTAGQANHSSPRNLNDVRVLPLLRSSPNKRRQIWCSRPGAGTAPGLGTVHAVATRVEAAIPALPNKPERPAVADVARPLDQGVVGLDHDK